MGGGVRFLKGLISAAIFLIALLIGGCGLMFVYAQGDLISNIVLSLIIILIFIPFILTKKKTPKN